MASTRFIDRKGRMAKNNNNGKIINSQAAMNKAIKSICDIRVPAIDSEIE